MATTNQKRWAMAAMERRLAVAKGQLLQQQQQKDEKDKKSSSHIDASSKELHQVESLPTPSKTSTKKDSKDDDYVAYTKLSHPVDENLLSTNVKFCSAKGIIVDKVLHNLLRSGDSAQKYLQGTKSVKLDNYILLDNFVQSRSSASASKKALQKNSKCSKSRMSMKRLKKFGALHLPEHLQKYRDMELCITLIPDVNDTYKTILRNWPERLNHVPQRIKTGMIQRTKIVSFKAYTNMWQRRVLYYNTKLKFLTNGRYRNIIDIEHWFGQFRCNFDQMSNVGYKCGSI